MQIDCAAAAAQAAGIPVIECQRLPQREGWACDIFVVPSCPFCGLRHTHGGDEGLRSVLTDVTEEKLPAEPLIRDYLEGLSCIHTELRKVLRERVEGWMTTVRKAIAEFVAGSPDGSTLGLCAIQLGRRDEWIEAVPLVEDMLERLVILQKRNGSLQRLTRSFVSSAPHPAKEKQQQVRK